MLFEEAMKKLADGHYVSRNAWDVTTDYLAFLPGMQFIWKVVTQPAVGAGNWQPMMADLLADDWKVVCKKDDNAISEPVAA